MIDIYDLEKVLVSKISFKNLIDLRTKKYLMDINYPSLYVFGLIIMMALLKT
jgi:hypothetical protein